MTHDEEAFYRRTESIDHLTDAIIRETGTICFTIFATTLILLIGFTVYTQITRDNIKCDEVLNKLNNLTAPEYFMLTPVPKERLQK